jgi:hypothetical protein
MERKWIDDFIEYYFSNELESVSKGITLKDKFIPRYLFRYRTIMPKEEKGVIYAIVETPPCGQRLHL